MYLDHQKQSNYSQRKVVLKLTSILSNEISKPVHCPYYTKFSCHHCNKRSSWNKEILYRFSKAHIPTNPVTMCSCFHRFDRKLIKIKLLQSANWASWNKHEHSTKNKANKPKFNSLIPLNGTWLLASLLTLMQDPAWKIFSKNRLFHVEHCLPKTASTLAAYVQPKCGPLQK